MCCQLTESIWAFLFCFINISFHPNYLHFTPPPPQPQPTILLATVDRCSKVSLPPTNQLSTKATPLPLPRSRLCLYIEKRNKTVCLYYYLEIIFRDGGGGVSLLYYSPIPIYFPFHPRSVTRPTTAPSTTQKSQPEKVDWGGGAVKYRYFSISIQDLS